MFKLEHNNIVVFTPEDLANPLEHNALLQKIETQLKEEHLYYIVDLAKLSFLNSSGLNFLIQMLTKVRNANGDIVITNITESIHKILVITRLQSTFTTVKSIDEGLIFFKDLATSE